MELQAINDSLHQVSVESMDYVEGCQSEICSLFLVLYITSLQQQISNPLIAHTMSTFGKHPLTVTNGIVSSIIGAIIKLPMSKVSDFWGRIELFAVVVFVTVLGRPNFEAS